MMINHRATLVAYVEPPGVQWVNNEGSSTLHHIYQMCLDNYRYAVVKRNGKYEVIDFYSMRWTAEGSLMPALGVMYDDPDAAVVATVLLNP